jgi:hypothetical protein
LTEIAGLDRLDRRAKRPQATNLHQRPDSDLESRSLAGQTANAFEKSHIGKRGFGVK